MNPYRIAAFFAPPTDHPLWQVGSCWLGRDASLAQPVTLVPGSPAPALDESLRVAPRRYGFHATLKPPFRFAPPFDAQQVCDKTRAIASRIAAFEMPVLSVQWLDGFLALRPANPDDEQLTPLKALAAQLVRGLDACRLPATPAELTARRRPEMSALQLAMLSDWGYPYVLDAWRFHMTLTGRLSSEQGGRDEIFARATEYFSHALREPLWCRDVCLFVEPAPGEPFQLWRRVALTG